MNEVRHAPVAAQKPSITATVCGLASKRISGKSSRLSVLRLFKHVRALQLEVHEAGFGDALPSPFSNRRRGYFAHLRNGRSPTEGVNDFTSEKVAFFHAHILGAPNRQSQAHVRPAVRN